MGSQQVLLIVLSIIIVGVSIAGAIGIFKLQAQKSNRSAIIQDMYNIANMAITFFKTPTNNGGGGDNWDVDNFKKFCSYPLTNNGRDFETANGRIRVVEISRNRLRIKGWGTELGFDEDKAIQARLILSGADSENMAFKILN